MPKIISVIIAAVIFFLAAVPVHGESAVIDYGSDRLEEAVPDEAAEILDEQGITPENGGALSLTFGDVLSSLWDMIKERAAAPLKLLVSLCGVVMLSALAGTISENGGMKRAFSAVSVLAGAGITVAAVYDVISDTLSLLSAAAAFMLAFIPIFTGIAAVLGHITAASAVNASTLAATQLFSQLAVNFLAPLCGSIMGLSAAGAVCPELDLSKLGGLIKKFVIWALTLIMTVFTSVLSAQSFVANASDSALLRTAKFVVSSGVPIVGGTISDAAATVQGGLIMLKSSVGTYGLAAAAAMILPVLITVFCYRAAMACAQAAGEIFGCRELATLFESCGAVMSIIIAVISCFLLLNIIAVVIMAAAAG